MADPVLTQAMLDVAGCDLVGALALGKTVSAFAGQMVGILTLKMAEAAAHDADTISYTINGREVKRSLDQAQQALEYFRGLSVTGAAGGGGLVYRSIGFTA